MFFKPRKSVLGPWKVDVAVRNRYLKWNPSGNVDENPRSPEWSNLDPRMENQGAWEPGGEPLPHGRNRPLLEARLRLLRLLPNLPGGHRRLGRRRLVLARQRTSKRPKKRGGGGPRKGHKNSLLKKKETGAQTSLQETSPKAGDTIWTRYKREWEKHISPIQGVERDEEKL